MTTRARKPLSFAVDQDPPPVVESKANKAAASDDRCQIGARIPVAKYRMLKAAAALQGVTVQALVEQGIDLVLASNRG